MEGLAKTLAIYFAIAIPTLIIGLVFYARYLYVKKQGKYQITLIPNFNEIVILIQYQDCFDKTISYCRKYDLSNVYFFQVREKDHVISLINKDCNQIEELDYYSDDLTWFRDEIIKKLETFLKNRIEKETTNV